MTKGDPFQFETDLVDLFWWLVSWCIQGVSFSEKGISLSLGVIHRLLVSSLRTFIRCIILDLSLALTTQIRPSQLRPPYTSSHHAHTRTELLQVMKVVLQAYPHWEEIIRIVFKS